MYERDIACALAHPYYTVAAPLTARHRRRLAELFAVWEVRNGARAPELNRPAEMYVATRDGIGIGGSDDHAGVDIGRTWTETPRAADPAAFLARVRAGRGDRPRRAGQRRQVGARGDRAGDPHARRRRWLRRRGRSRPAARADDGRAAAARGRPPRGQRRRRRLAGGRAGAAARLAAGARPRRPGRRAADRPHAGRGLQPRRSLPARLPRARAAPRRRRRDGARGGARRARRGERGTRALRRLRRRRPLRARRRVPGQRADQAARDLARGTSRPRGATSARAWRSSPTASAPRTGSAARSRRSASAASRASRSR